MPRKKKKDDGAVPFKLRTDGGPQQSPRPQHIKGKFLWTRVFTSA